MSQVVINDILPLTQAVATSGQTVYSTDWTANYASDVVVYSRPTNTPADDATQILAYPADYSVAFIGDQNIVQVTLVTASTLGDIVTITRQTPADRENLYTNTNFTPSMLNNDFGILTLVDQQAQLVNQMIAPRYNYSDFINPNPSYPTADTILPVLGASQLWAKNSGNTAIVAITIGNASTATLTNDAYPYVASTDGGFTPGEFVTTNDTLGTLVSGGYVPGTVLQINTGTGLSGGPLTTTGTLQFAPIAANSFWANMTNATATPSVHSLGSFLLAANNLSDLTNDSAAVANLGLTIGVNTQAHSALLDEITAGTWTGATSITTLGTIGTGTWQGTDITVGYGGTGTSSFTPYSIICAGITSTGHFQNVVGLGAVGSILTSNGPGELPSWTTGAGSVTPASIQNQTWTFSNDTGIANAYVATLNPPILATVKGLQVTLLVANTNTGASTLAVNTFGPDAITDTSKNALVAGQMVAGMMAILEFDGTQFQLINPIGDATGIVTAGTINELAYYAASGTTISGLSTADNGVLITSVSGVPSISSTLPAAVQANITALAPIASHDILSNITSGSASPIANTLTATIDAALGSTQGDILYRSASAWTVLGPGTSGYFLQTQGAAANPIWASTSSVTPAALTETNDTNVTLTLGGTPSTALLQATSITAGWTGTLSLARGGSGADLSASEGGIIYSTGSAMAVLAGTITANLPLLSANDDPPVWGSYALELGGILSTAGIVEFVGAYTFQGTLTGSTAVTFPTSGTLATTAGTVVTVDADSGSATASSGAVTISGGTTGLTTTASSATLDLTGTLAVGHGGTAVTSVTTAPTATSFAGWDANKNISANSLIPGYTSTAASGTAITLTVASTQIQNITGASTNQTINMPVTSTLVVGQQFYIINSTSSGTCIVQSSGGNGIIQNNLAFGWGAILTCVNTGVTTAAGWAYQAYPTNAYTFFSGTNISLSLSGGQYTINTNKWASYTENAVASSTQTIAVYNGYYTNNGATLVTFTLPSSAAAGSFFKITGYSSGGWTIAQNASQNIQIEGSVTTTGTGGSLSSTKANDCVEVLCVVANTTFVVRNSMGNLTIV